jgi:hypothetical protein
MQGLERDSLPGPPATPPGTSLIHLSSVLCGVCAQTELNCLCPVLGIYHVCVCMYRSTMYVCVCIGTWYLSCMCLYVSSCARHMVSILRAILRAIFACDLALVLLLSSFFTSRGAIECLLQQHARAHYSVSVPLVSVPVISVPVSQVYMSMEFGA